MGLAIVGCCPALAVCVVKDAWPEMAIGIPSGFVKACFNASPLTTKPGRSAVFFWIRPVAWLNNWL